MNAKKRHRDKNAMVNKRTLEKLVSTAVDVKLDWSFSFQVLQYLDTARTIEFC